MGYGRKSRYPRRKGHKKYKRALYSAPSKRTNRNNVYALSKQVSSIQRQVRARTVIGRFAHQLHLDIQGPFVCYGLTQPVQYRGLFGNAKTLGQRNRWNSLKFSMDFLLEVTDNDRITDFTIMIVSLKPGPANSVLYECGENLNAGNNGTGLRDEVEYESLAGRAMINLEKFKIHWLKRCSLGFKALIDGDTFVTKNVSDLQKRMYIKIPWRKRIQPGHQPTDFINVAQNTIPDTSKLWMIVFSDAPVTATPRIQGEIIWTVGTV